MYIILYYHMLYVMSSQLLSFGHMHDTVKPLYYPLNVLFGNVQLPCLKPCVIGVRVVGVEGELMKAYGAYDLPLKAFAHWKIGYLVFLYYIFLVIKSEFKRALGYYQKNVPGSLTAYHFKKAPSRKGIVKYLMYFHNSHLSKKSIKNYIFIIKYRIVFVKPL